MSHFAQTQLATKTRKTASDIKIGFADTFPPTQYDLVLGKEGEPAHPALLSYLEKAKTEFTDCTEIHLTVTGVNSRNGTFADTPEQVRSLSANIRVKQQDGRWDGRAVFIGGNEPTPLILLEIIPQSPEPNTQQAQSHFLMFRRRVLGYPEQSAFYPVEGRITKAEDGRYQVKIPYKNIQEVLTNFDLWKTSERIGLPVHPTCPTTYDEMREYSAARITMTPEVFTGFKGAIESLKYTDVRTSHIVPASDIIGEIRQGKLTSETLSGLQSLANQHLMDCWRSAATEVYAVTPKLPPIWVKELAALNNCGPT